MVATNYVISAAHCFMTHTNNTRIVPIPIIKESKASEIKAIIGEDNLLSIYGSMDDEDEDKPLKTIIRFVRKLTIPKEYVEKGQASRLDIAILRLNFPVNIEIYTPACLARTLDDGTFLNKEAWIAGWGAVRGWGEPLNVVSLNGSEVHEALIPVTKCPKRLKTILCSRDRNGEKATCHVTKLISIYLYLSLSISIYLYLFLSLYLYLSLS